MLHKIVTVSCYEAITPKNRILNPEIFYKAMSIYKTTGKLGRSMQVQSIVSLSPLSQYQSLLAQELTVMSPHPGDKETQQPD